MDPLRKRVLVSNFEGSQQKEDLSLPPNCGGFGRIHHFRRTQPSPWHDNPLPIDPAAKALGLGQLEEIKAQVFQNAICSWRCWYCFVDFDLLSANPKYSEFKTADELVDLYLREPERPSLIDLSGGQPDLVPEWGLWMVEALQRRDLNSVYLWTDDNLSNDYLWRVLTSDQIRKLASFGNYGRVGCFKGFDPKSFSFNTKAHPELFKEQFALMSRLVRSRFDVYGYVTLTAADDSHIEQKIADFIDRLQECVHANFPLRTVPLKVSVFSPTAARLGPNEERSLKIQELAVSAWNAELNRRYPPDVLQKKITEHHLSNR